MPSSVVVIEFDEPETFKGILDKIKDLFEEVDGVHIFAAVNEDAQRVLSIVQAGS